MIPRPLAGVHVVDLSQFIAGPLCAQLLADFGASVTKVEPLTGDPSRLLPGTPHGSIYFRAFNTNKKSVTLDLRSADGRQRLDELLSESQACVMNFSPRALKRLKLEPEILHESFPDLVVTVISGYGLGDDRLSFDPIAQSESGFAYYNGGLDGRPRIAKGYLVDQLAGYHAALATAMSLAEQPPKRALMIDVSMRDAILSFMAPELIRSTELGVAVSPGGDADSTTAPSNLYQCSDGYCYMYAGLDHHYAALRSVLPHLPDWSLQERLDNATDLDAMITKWTGRLTVSEVVRRISEAKVPIGPVRTVLETLREPTGRPPIVQEKVAGSIPNLPALFDGERVGRRPAPPLRDTKNHQGEA
jgi:crotonobetainyl-CoA:carnitine CoA-transferase CaiB-like acyl-CoA transferase